MFSINPEANRNDYRVGSGDGTIVVAKRFDAGTGQPYWTVTRNVYNGHKDENKVYARRCKSFAEADAIATREAPNA